MTQSSGARQDDYLKYDLSSIREPDTLTSNQIFTVAILAIEHVLNPACLPVETFDKGDLRIALRWLTAWQLITSKAESSREINEILAHLTGY